MDNYWHPRAVALVAVRLLVVLGLAALGVEGASGDPVKLPGLVINLDEHCVDVQSTVCLDEGTLELVACTKDSKEHESIVAVEARAMHIHTALLLLGVKAGNPAMKKVASGEEVRWVPVQPSGAAIDVSLLVRGEGGGLVERPISDFIKGVAEDGRDGGKRRRFTGKTFVFAGSHLEGEGPGPRQYLADRSGNVISLSTFGDEVLCLPGRHGHENGALLWEVDATHLPEVGGEVTLRLRPKKKAPLKPVEKATQP